MWARLGVVGGVQPSFVAVLDGSALARASGWRRFRAAPGRGRQRVPARARLAAAGRVVRVAAASFWQNSRCFALPPGVSVET